MKVIIALLFSFFMAKADQIVDLNAVELQSTRFYAQCMGELKEHPYSVLAGSRGTFQQGLLYQYKLETGDGRKLTLDVKWTKATRKYDCKIFEN